MNFKISDNTRMYVKSTTGHTCDEIISMPLNEDERVNPNNFSPFRDSKAEEIQPRGSIYLQMGLIAKLKDVSRQFFNF